MIYVFALMCYFTSPYNPDFCIIDMMLKVDYLLSPLAVMFNLFKLLFPASSTTLSHVFVQPFLTDDSEHLRNVFHINI